MKKRWKGVLIFCGVLAIVGAGLCIAAVSMGFSRADIPELKLHFSDIVKLNFVYEKGELLWR